MEQINNDNFHCFIPVEFSKGEKELVYTGTVNWDGVAELELIEIIEDWKKTEKK